MHLPLTLTCLGICNKELELLETSRSGIPSRKGAGPGRRMETDISVHLS